MQQKSNNLILLGLLRKFHPENEMLEAETVHLAARLDGVAVIREADKCKALGHTRLPVLRQEYPGDAAEPLKHVAQLALFCHLGHLASTVSFCPATLPEWGDLELTLVTRRVAKSSLSPNLPPIRSPAGRSPRRAGGTYEPFLPAGPAPAPAGPASSGIPAATSAAPLAPTGAMVSL